MNACAIPGCPACNLGQAQMDAQRQVTTERRCQVCEGDGHTRFAACFKCGGSGWERVSIFSPRFAVCGPTEEEIEQARTENQARDANERRLRLVLAGVDV